jgi:hypothetical protein
LREWPQRAAERFGCCDQQVSQLAEPGALGVHRAFACHHQRLQRLAVTAGPRCLGPLAREHTCGLRGPREGVCLAARATLPPHPANHEHSLATRAQEAGQTGTKRSGPLDSERTPTSGVHVGELQCL